MDIPDSCCFVSAAFIFYILLLPLCIWRTTQQLIYFTELGVMFLCLLLSVCLFNEFLVCLLCLSRRLIRRIPRATAASQDLRFCCRNSWRGNRCRKRWLSSYERGISFLISYPAFSFFFFMPYAQVTMKTIQFSLKQSVTPFVHSVMYITVLHNTGNAHGNSHSCVKAVW